MAAQTEHRAGYRHGRQSQWMSKIMHRAHPLNVGQRDVFVSQAPVQFQTIAVENIVGTPKCIGAITQQRDGSKGSQSHQQIKDKRRSNVRAREIQESPSGDRYQDDQQDGMEQESVTLGGRKESGDHTLHHVIASEAKQSSCNLQMIARSEEHTSELQSPTNLVCRLLLE